MPTHRFKIGETVLVEAARHLNFPGGAYVVTAKLPQRDGEFEYRVRSSDEPHERVVRENLLRAAPQPVGRCTETAGPGEYTGIIERWP